jgi:hypothetical protein
MAWFITFYKKVPKENIDPRYWPKQSVRPMDQLTDVTKPDDSVIQSACSRFAAEMGVASWKDAADGYDLSEIDYQ